MTILPIQGENAAATAQRLAALFNLANNLSLVVVAGADDADGEALANEAENQGANLGVAGVAASVVWLQAQAEALADPLLTNNLAGLNDTSLGFATGRLHGIAIQITRDSVVQFGPAIVVTDAWNEAVAQ